MAPIGNPKWSRRLMGLGFLALVVAPVALVWSYSANQRSTGTNTASLDVGKDTDTLELVGAPGEPVKFLITYYAYADDLWRSGSGLSIVTDGKKQQVIAPRHKTWPTTLPTTTRSGDTQMSLKAEYTIPKGSTVGQTLRGAFDGDITYVELVSSVRFDNKEIQVRNPVEILVVDRAAYAAQQKQLATIELWVGIAAAVLVPVCVLFAGMIQKRSMP